MSKYLMLLTHAAILATLLATSHAVLKWVSVQAHDNYIQLLLSQWKGVFLALSLYGFIFFYYIVVQQPSVYTLSCVHRIVSAAGIAGRAFCLCRAHQFSTDAGRGIYPGRYRADGWQ